MRIVKRFFLFLGVCLLAVIGVCLVNTLRFQPERFEVALVAPAQIDQEAVAKNLARAIQCRTISVQDPAQFDWKPFLELHKFLEEAFPRVYAALQHEAVNQYSLLFSWQGSDPSLKPLLLTAHQDVVPIEPGTEKEWKYPPFDGAIADGFIWGRGALDDKLSLMGLLEAVDFLVREGFQPKRTIYLGFGHDEEVGGNNGAPAIAETLHGRNVRLGFVLDEGSGTVQGVVPGIASPVAVIGVAEKGYATFELRARMEGGHSSTPPPQTAIGVLARAVARIEACPFPVDMSHAKRFFDHVGREMPFLQKMVFANMWLTTPLIERVVSANPVLNASIRTTAAPVIFNAGFKENVIPSEAQASVNCRILPGETVESTIARIKDIIHDKRIAVVAVDKPCDPSRVSSTDGPNYEVLHKTICQIFGASGKIVAPFLVLGATDSRSYSGIADNIYRYLPVVLDGDDMKRIHGSNERLSLEGYTRLIRFYVQLIKNAN